ncbi:unnamed protein product [Closterium sp. NIES-65]|nr:unnamed protein product [Closterium sp. NIES-65]
MANSIVVVDPVSQKVVTKINQTSQGAPAPFPNSCPGHPMQGTWNRHTTGIDQQTIFITASFQQPTPLRLPGLSDMVLVVNTSSQSVAASVAVPDIPNDIVFVPEVVSADVVWIGEGIGFAPSSASRSRPAYQSLPTPPLSTAFNLFTSVPSPTIPSNSCPFSPIPIPFFPPIYPPVQPAAALNGKAFQTASQMPGVFSLNLFTQSTDVPFLDFTQAMLQSEPWLPPDTPIYCPATREAVYSAVNRRAYVSCAKAGSPPDPNAPEPGIVEIAGDDSVPVGYLNFKVGEGGGELKRQGGGESGVIRREQMRPCHPSLHRLIASHPCVPSVCPSQVDRLYLMPDETFLLAVDSRANAHIPQARTLLSHPCLPLPCVPPRPPRAPLVVPFLSPSQADRLYLTPDETFLLAVDSGAGVIRMVQMLPGVGSDQVFSLQWPDVTLPPNSMPDKILFYPKVSTVGPQCLDSSLLIPWNLLCSAPTMPLTPSPPCPPPLSPPSPSPLSQGLFYGMFYVALVSLVLKDSTAVIDFNKLLACGAQCPQDNIAAALTFINTGYHVAPRANMDLSISSRSLAVGHQFVCVAANHDKAVHCSNLVNPANNKIYTNMFDVQDIVFVEGKYPGDQSFIRPIDITFDCSSAPTTLDKPPPPPSPLDLAVAAHLRGS